MKNYFSKKKYIKTVLISATILLLSTVASFAQPLAASAGSNQTICNGNSVTIGGSPSATFGAGGYTYFWSPATGLSSATVANPVANPTTTTTYTLTVTDAVAATANATVVVTVNPIPVATSTPGAQTICSGNNCGLALSSTVGGSTYSWTVSQSGVTGATPGGGAAISQSLTATGITAGTATYTITPTASGCVGSPITAVVTVNPAPSITSPGTANICSGGTLNIPITSNITSTYTWSAVDNPNTTGESTSPQTTSTINNTINSVAPISTNVSYTVQATSLAGCGGTFYPITVTVNSIPAATSTPTAQTVCSGINTNFSLSSTIPGTSFNWTTTGTGVSGNTPGSGTVISQSINATLTTAGTANYSVIPTSPAGCVGTSINATATVNPIPVATATPNSQSICSGNFAAINWTSNVAGTSFTWTSSQTNASGATPSGGGTSVSDFLVATTSTAGTVAYLITPVANGCTGSAIFPFVTVTPMPDATFSLASPACQNTGTMLPNISGTAGVFTSVPAGLVFVSATTGEIDLNASTPGTYSITNTIAAAGGCPVATTNTGYTISPYMDPTITPVAPLCANDIPFNLTAATTGGTWSGNGITNTSLGTFDPSVSGTGTHAIVYSAASPCFFLYRDTTYITVNPDAATATAGPDRFACVGTSVNFTNFTAGIVSFLWDFDDGTQSTLANPTHVFASSGTYHVSFKGYNSSGCESNTDTAMVYIYDNPVITTTSSSVVGCSGTCNATVYTVVTGGSAPYTYDWGVLAVNNDSVTAVCSGTYTMIVTDANACADTSTIAVNTNPTTDIYGHVTYSGGDVNTGTNIAVLYERLATFTSFDSIQVDTIDASGYYHFTNIPASDYLVKIFADTLIYPTTVPTYYDSEFLWDSAMVKTHGCALPDTADVLMVEGVAGVGPGMLTGYVSAGAGFVRAPGDPVPGIDVKLGRNPGGHMMTNTQTNGSGNYTFNNIPVNAPGEWYTIYVDIPGLVRDSVYNITVTATNTTFTSLDYIADSNSVYPVYPTSVSVANAHANDVSMSVYPNPSNVATTVAYTLKTDANVQLDVYDVLGKKVEAVLNTNQQSGSYKANITKLKAGIYFVILHVNNRSNTTRLVVID